MLEKTTKKPDYFIEEVTPSSCRDRLKNTFFSYFSRKTIWEVLTARRWPTTDFGQRNFSLRLTFETAKKKKPPRISHSHSSRFRLKDGRKLEAHCLGVLQRCLPSVATLTVTMSYYCVIVVRSVLPHSFFWTSVPITQSVIGTTFHSVVCPKLPHSRLRLIIIVCSVLLDSLFWTSVPVTQSI